MFVIRTFFIAILLVLNTPPLWACAKRIPYIDQVIHFDSGSAKIRKESIPVLEDVVQFIKTNSDSYSEIIVEGHADNRESRRNSQELSEKRAEAVINYLLKSNVTVPLRIVFYGSQRPVADPATPEGRAKNRRVEFPIVPAPEPVQPPLPPCIPNKHKPPCPVVPEC